MTDTSAATLPPVGEAGPLDRSAESLRIFVEAIVDHRLDQIRSTQGELFESGLDISAESLGMLRLLAARSNQSQGELIDKALTLYGLALDAVERGQKVAILSPDDEIIRDINGIDGPKSPAEAGTP